MPLTYFLYTTSVIFLNLFTVNETFPEIPPCTANPSLEPYLHLSTKPVAQEETGYALYSMDS